MRFSRAELCGSGAGAGLSRRHSELAAASRACLVIEEVARGRAGLGGARRASDEVLRMNCHDFEKVVLSLARNSLLDAATREQGLIHTEVCEGCAARLAEERALLARVRAVVDEMAGEEPPARVDAALLAAFRAQTTATAPSTVFATPGRARHWSSWKSAAVAAGILILISVMAFWRSEGSHKPQR